MIEVHSAHHAHFAREVDQCREFFALIVEPAIEEFNAAEIALTDAVLRSIGDVHEARALLLRRARTASIELHQFVDRVGSYKPTWASGGDTRAIHSWLKEKHLRKADGQPVEDLDILHDVANAFKHARLTRPKKGRDLYIEDDSAVISIGTGWGELPHGEGHFGGTEQLIVELKTLGQKRAVSMLLLSVADAWRSAMKPAKSQDC